MTVYWIPSTLTPADQHKVELQLGNRSLQGGMSQQPPTFELLVHDNVVDTSDAATIEHALPQFLQYPVPNNTTLVPKSVYKAVMLMNPIDIGCGCGGSCESTQECAANGRQLINRYLRMYAREFTRPRVREFSVRQTATGKTTRFAAAHHMKQPPSANDVRWGLVAQNEVSVRRN